MKWEKRGIIYGIEQTPYNMIMLPTPILIGDTLRIYCGLCDKNNIGKIGYVDVNPKNPSEIIKIENQPVLAKGNKGCFDDNGVVPISVLREKDKIYLYYIGFQLGVNIPYYMFCGLAVSSDEGNTFQRYSQSPVLDRVNDEVYARCGCYVLKDENKFKMWYIGSYKEGWTVSENKWKPLYVMKYTESQDGIHWHNESVQCMEFGNSDEHGFGRPFVWKADNKYKMLYSIRTYSRGYYIGYAESEDGISWIRKDGQAGIDLSKEGWDDTNISYPALFEYEGKVYMFYNGNGCGKTGFGYAELIEE